MEDPIIDIINISDIIIYLLCMKYIGWNNRSNSQYSLDTSNN